MLRICVNSNAVTGRRGIKQCGALLGVAETWVISRSAEHDKSSALLMAAPSPKGARKLLCGGRNFNINKKYREKYLLFTLKKAHFYAILTL